MNTDDKQPKRAIIYARVSSEDQVSTTAQIEAITKHLNKIGRDIIGIVEEKRSAKDREDTLDVFEYMKQRPELYNKCYKSAERHECDEVWCWKWDRLSRSDFQPIMFRAFKKHNVNLMTLIDSNDPTVRDIQGVLSKREIEEIKKRVELRHQELLKKKRVLNKPPLGYRFRRHKLIPDDNIKAVKKAFELTLKGLKPKEICNQVKIKKGKKVYNISITTYKRAIHNKIYAGIYYYRKQECQGDFETPLKDLFNQVQQILEERKNEIQN